MQAGIGLFARDGYEGTSVKAIADEAGVNISLISYHFGGKEGLYRSCIDQFGRERLAIAQRVLIPAATKEEFKFKLQMFIEEFLACFVEQPELTKIVQGECEKEFPIVQDIFQKTFLKIFETLHGFVVSGQKKGFVRSDLDPFIFVTSFFGGISHFSRVDNLSHKYFDHTLKSPTYRKKVCDQLLNLALKGIFK